MVNLVTGAEWAKVLYPGLNKNYHFYQEYCVERGLTPPPNVLTEEELERQKFLNNYDLEHETVPTGYGLSDQAYRILYNGQDKETQWFWDNYDKLYESFEVSND